MASDSLVLEAPGVPLDVGGGVGLFDSGLGGLSVLTPLLSREPCWPSVLIADQAHVPYGGRPLDEVRSFALAQTALLFELGVAQVAMACNISSATALDEARQRHGADRVYGMVEPGCAQAVARTAAGRVAVLATEGTVRSGAYARQLAELDPRLQCLALACPEFVPLVEAGHFSDATALHAVRPYVERVRAFGADVAILGCTHYPHLLPALQAAAPELIFVDPATTLADALAPGLTAAADPRDPILLTTADPARLHQQVRALYGDALRPTVHAVAWRSLVDAGPSSTVG